jgi:hypothetical protein
MLLCIPLMLGGIGLLAFALTRELGTREAAVKDG